MILAVSKRWHLWRHRFARWRLQRARALIHRLESTIAQSGALANEQHDTARMRLEVCMRCPDMLANGNGCWHCPCYMPAKRQATAATCSHPTDKRW